MQSASQHDVEQGDQSNQDKEDPLYEEIISTGTGSIQKDDLPTPPELPPKSTHKENLTAQAVADILAREALAVVVEKKREQMKARHDEQKLKRLEFLHSHVTKQQLYCKTGLIF